MKQVSIGVDARPLTGQLTGIGRYVLDLCQRIDAAMPHALFYAYSPYPLSVTLPSSRWTIRRPNHVPPLLGGYFWFKFLSSQLIRRDDLQWFFGTRTLLPPLPSAVRTLSLVHDFNHILAPATMTSLNRAAHACYFRPDIARATRLLVNSRGTAEKLEQYYGRRADLVVPPRVAASFHRVTDSQVKAARRHFGLPQSYLLSVATMEPRKNLAALVDAYCTLRQAGRLADHSLVLAGGGGWRQGALARRLRNGVPGVRRLGYVDEALLPGLYAGASAFVFPSIYEGFGIPVAEALACGTPVVCTNIPELREAADGKAILVGTNPASIADGILRALDGPRPSKSMTPNPVHAASIAKLFD